MCRAPPWTSPPLTPSRHWTRPQRCGPATKTRGSFRSAARWRSPIFFWEGAAAWPPRCPRDSAGLPSPPPPPLFLPAPCGRVTRPGAWRAAPEPHLRVDARPRGLVQARRGAAGGEPPFSLLGTCRLPPPPAPDPSRACLDRRCAHLPFLVLLPRRAPGSPPPERMRPLGHRAREGVLGEAAVLGQRHLRGGGSPGDFGETCPCPFPSCAFREEEPAPRAGTMTHSAPSPTFPFSFSFPS